MIVEAWLKMGPSGEEGRLVRIGWNHDMIV